MLTFDIDGVSGALNVDPESARFPGLMSVREYGPSVGVPRILELLAERGFVYDSRLMGNDIPYLVDAGRRRIVEVPTHWELDDVAYFNYAPSLGIRQFMATPNHVY